MRTPRLAQEAMREAIDRALAAKLSGTELRVFVALLRIVALWDRTTDHVANRQVVDATGLDPRHVRRALLSLNAKGVVERIPGKGKTASRITFPPAGSSDPEGAEPAPLEDERGGGIRPGGGGGFGHPEGADFDTRGGAHAPASEVLPEVLPEVEECVLEPEVVHTTATRRMHTRLRLRHPSDDNVDELLGKLHILDGKYLGVDEALAALDFKYQWPSEVIEAIKPHLQAKTCDDNFAPLGAQVPVCDICHDGAGEYGWANNQHICFQCRELAVGA